VIDADPMPGARAGRLRRWLAPIARTFLLFLLVYLPAFAAVALFELEIDAAVPAIMGITTAMALLLVAILARRQHLTAGGFGLRGSEWRPLLRGLLLGLPLGLAATWAQHLTGEGSAGQDVPLTPGMSVLLFVVGASIQEELIFRGLLQTVLARNLAGALRVAGASISHAALSCSDSSPASSGAARGASCRPWRSTPCSISSPWGGRWSDAGGAQAAAGPCGPACRSVDDLHGKPGVIALGTLRQGAGFAAEDPLGRPLPR
jgi:hypothetical protein